MHSATTPTTPEELVPSKQVTLDDLIPEKQIPEKYPHLYTEKSWRWAVVQRKHNGLARAFRKIGRNVFVNVKTLAECMDEQLES